MVNEAKKGGKGTGRVVGWREGGGSGKALGGGGWAEMWCGMRHCMRRVSD